MCAQRTQDQPGHPPSFLHADSEDCRCPDWSESSLGAHAILLVLSWGGSNGYLVTIDTPVCLINVEQTNVVSFTGHKLLPRCHCFFSLEMTCGNKNLSWLFRVDRKMSAGSLLDQVLSDAKQKSQAVDFSFHTNTVMIDSFSCIPILSIHFVHLKYVSSNIHYFKCLNKFLEAAMKVKEVIFSLSM